MGRKPHWVIQQNFARGAKLEDSSNRYQHTCNSCGERFPKGRIDSLLAHLLRKCPGISNENRQRILQDLVDKPNHNGSYNQLAVAMRNEQLGNDPTLQYNQNMSALETLAEVSRQQLDTTDGNEHETLEAPSNAKKRKRRRATDAQQRLQTTFPIRGEQFDPQMLAMPPPQNDQAPAAPEELFPGLAQYAAADLSSVAPTARMVPDQLALTASAATQMMPTTDSLIDPVNAHNSIMVNSTTTVPEVNGHVDEPPADSIDPQLEQPVEIAPEPSPPPQFPLDKSLLLGPRTVSSNPDMPHVHFFNNFLLGHGSNRRVRGRFSDVRRKEVQEVRKQGACVRCRMLKKPCSGGTPCTTCQNVESARLWKIPCLRARIADEFDLYSSGIQTIITFQEMSENKDSDTFHVSSKQIEATQFPGKVLDQPLRLKSVRGQSRQDVSQTHEFLDEVSLASLDLELADTESQDVAGKLEEHFQNITRSMFERENSRFMRHTVETAAGLVALKMDPLLSRALELWLATNVFTDPNAMWTFHSSPPSADTEAINRRNGSTHREEISATLRPLNHRLLNLQIRAFIEKLSAQLAKVLINDLEKRLLQRQQTSAQHFETFITAIILLNCIERLCWLFQTWAIKFEQPEIPNADQDGLEGQLASFGDQVHEHERGTWPLADRSPHSFVEKGMSIANLIAMLLKMRGIPPATTVGTNGTLRFSPSGSSNTRKNQLQSQRHSQDHDTSNDELVAHLAQAAAAAASGPADESQQPIDSVDSVAPELASAVEAAAAAAADPAQSQANGDANQQDTAAASSAAENRRQAQTSVAAMWFEKVGVTEEQLRVAQAAESFDEDNYRCWDLRFIARLLLPEE